MSAPAVCTIDFETEGFDENPLVHPPKAVGVSIEYPNEQGRYYSFGHPTKNNSTVGEACEALERARNSGLPLLFQNAGFDLAVWMHLHPYFKTMVSRIPWNMVHDTMFLLFLQDPYSQTFSLKPSAHRYLGIPPDEQDDMKRWIQDNVPDHLWLGPPDHKGERKRRDWGFFISYTPGDLAAKYATGDTLRTKRLFDHLYPLVVEQRNMGAAYDRERRLLAVTFSATRRGVRCDRERLEKDTAQYTEQLEKAEYRLCAKVGITRAQLEDDEEALKDGLERCGAVKKWVLTPKDKKRSLAQGNLNIVIPEIQHLMEYRGALKTCLQTFMRPWLWLSRHDGRLHPNWNQVKQPKGEYDKKGTKTGRLSSDDPNFQNLPTDWIYDDGKLMVVPAGFSAYPTIRRYVLPEEGHVWLKRDFSSQEIRILAHFEDGALALAYRSNPDLDPHNMAKDMIEAITGMVLDRHPVKITGFSIIYGTGGPGLSARLKVPIDEARAIKRVYLAAMPGVSALMKDVELRGRMGVGIRTWGGRVYFAEPPRKDKETGRTWEFFYKLLNYLIQGSAADQTKDCINEWDNLNRNSIFLATVHDEINISAPKECWVECMTELKGVMEADRFAVPFKTEGFVGPNWYDLEKCA